MHPPRRPGIGRLWRPVSAVAVAVTVVVWEALPEGLSKDVRGAVNSLATRLCRVRSSAVRHGKFQSLRLRAEVCSE